MKENQGNTERQAVKKGSRKMQRAKGRKMRMKNTGRRSG